MYFGKSKIPSNLLSLVSILLSCFFFFFHFMAILHISQIPSSEPPTQNSQIRTCIFLLENSSCFLLFPLYFSLFPFTCTYLLARLLFLLYFLHKPQFLSGLGNIYRINGKGFYISHSTMYCLLSLSLYSPSLH
jgi:hypothetical protein